MPFLDVFVHSDIYIYMCESIVYFVVYAFCNGELIKNSLAQIFLAFNPDSIWSDTVNLY